MKVKLFITSTVALLGTWLGLAYTHQVDMDSYPRLGKGSLPLVGDLSNRPSETPERLDSSSETAGK